MIDHGLEGFFSFDKISFVPRNSRQIHPGRGGQRAVGIIGDERFVPCPAPLFAFGGRQLCLAVVLADFSIAPRLFFCAGLAELKVSESGGRDDQPGR